MYNTFNNTMRKRFGCKVYKLTLGGGMTCPTRDGTLGTRGCIFCSAGGSGEFAAQPCGSITEQLKAAKQKIAAKVPPDSKYIAYFQDYTNTYAPVETLRKLFAAALAPQDIVALSIATRPDCLPDDVIELLAELNRKKPVWVELGLQTIHPQTAEYIRRGYNLNCFESAVRRLKAAGIEIIVHLIIGLPGETPEMIYNSIKYIGRCGVDGIKLQLLHVLKGTDLAADYLNGKFEVLSLDEYTEILEECVQLLPKSIVIHRLTGDGAKSELIAPQWSADKKRVLNYINAAFRKDGVEQGSKALG